MIELGPAPVRRPFFSIGTLTLLALMAIGFSFGLARFFTGLGAVTNLDDRYPWGIWIAIDVACGVALAAGGFTSAALIEIFGRRRFHPFLRPAILTAWLGYFLVAIALLFDLGRYWNIWQPIFHWQGNSVLFEVGMCVMAYLVVLSIEMAPTVLEGLRDRIERREAGSALLARVERPMAVALSWVKVILPIFIAAGVVLSCMHQSSLGTLMVIAPSKLSRLWYTPFLPALFLLSAMTVGYPMVILESILAASSFRRRPEMDLLAPLARIIPWFLGLYAIAKFGDLAWRWGELDFLGRPNATTALVIEVVVGIAAPFVLLSLRSVRRSAGWLFFSSLLVILGVVLNRVNVFLVGYDPPFAQKSYFPAIGEIALTVSMVCTIMFLYRVLVVYFPVLPGSPERVRRISIAAGEPTISPFWEWVFRGTAVLMLLLFVALYSLVHREAIDASKRALDEVQVVRRTPRKSADGTLAHSHAFRPQAYRNFYVLNSDILNQKTDDYEPVRFSHRTHDVNEGGDCSVCHHRLSFSDDDRIGEDLRTMHASIDVRMSGSCTSCHEKMEDKNLQSCARCHERPDEPDAPARLGLKGAYHRQCIGCHQQQPPTANAPTDCASCHHPIVPDHAGLTRLDRGVTAQQVTRRCLECHASSAADVLKTAHWNWKGRTSPIAGREHSIDVGIVNTVDNYDINIVPNPGLASRFHIGYGWHSGDSNDAPLIDCLVCHDTTGTYAKDPSDGSQAAAGLDLALIASKVGRPSRGTCGSCHFFFGGGPNVKQGDLEPALSRPDATMDVHMGMVDMRCQDCHATSRHQVAGLSFAAPVMEGRVTCEKCHGSTPHGITGFLSRHLDDHVRAIACETCHIPSFAKVTPTRLSVDYSVAGQDRSVVKDALGMPNFDKRYGTLTWGRDVIPAYRWFGGTRRAYVAGDSIDPSGIVVLNAPIGEKRDPASRIYPFKIHLAVQPYDLVEKRLVTPRFEGGYWNDFDWQRSIIEGMRTMRLTYSGQYGFVKTEMYTSLHHEVAPAQKALGCADCHDSQAITCSRCHKNARNLDQPEHTRKIYPESPNRLDFKALGYDDDPARIGGRFYVQLGRGTPPR